MLAAIRAGMEKVILPEDNRGDWEELDADVRGAVSVEFVDRAVAAFTLLFGEEILRGAG